MSGPVDVPTRTKADHQIDRVLASLDVSERLQLPARAKALGSNPNLVSQIYC
jgi:hypothetical protein